MEPLSILEEGKEIELSETCSPYCQGSSCHTPARTFQNVVEPMDISEKRKTCSYTSGSASSASSEMSDSDSNTDPAFKAQETEAEKLRKGNTTQPCPDPVPFNFFSASKEETEKEKLERIKSCFSTDPNLMAKTLKTVNSALIASGVPQESRIRKRVSSENGFGDEFKNYRNCSIYVHPNLMKLQDQFQNHLRSLMIAGAFLEDYLDIKNKEPQGFPTPGFLRTSEDLDEWRKSKFSYNVSITTADRIPMCTYEYEYHPEENKSLESFFDFMEPNISIFSDDKLKDMVEMREESLNLAVELQNNEDKKNADDDMSLQEECDSEKLAGTSPEKCCYCSDFIREYENECNDFIKDITKENENECSDSVNISNEEGEEAIKEQLKHLLEELKITNSKNIIVRDKLTARLIQNKQQLSLEEELDENAKQMWVLFTNRLNELEEQRRKESERAQKKMEQEKQLLAESAGNEEEEMSYEEVAGHMSTEVSLNMQETEPVTESEIHETELLWETDIKELLAARENLFSDYQRFKSKKRCDYMNEHLITHLNSALQDLGEFKEQKTVKSHLRGKNAVSAPIFIKVSSSNL